jgi:hypothetical protein
MDELDVTLAFANLASEMQLVRPNLTDEYAVFERYAAFAQTVIAFHSKSSMVAIPP